MNEGSAARPGGEALRLPESGGYGANTPNEKNYGYMVWSAKPIDRIEELKKLRLEGGMAVIDGPKTREVQEFLKSLTEGVRVQEVSLEKQ